MNLFNFVFKGGYDDDDEFSIPEFGGTNQLYQSLPGLSTIDQEDNMFEPIDPMDEHFGGLVVDKSKLPSQLGTSGLRKDFGTISGEFGSMSSVPKEVASIQKPLSSIPGRLSTAPGISDLIPAPISSSSKHLGSVPESLGSIPSGPVGAIPG